MIYLDAISDLWRRNKAVFKAAWAIRHQLDAPLRLEHELAFLPAHLELAETPVHPAPRWTMRCIGALALLILGIGMVGQLDIVASAKGKLVPNARVKVIQPAITGVVQAIYVQDGQRVKAGELLMELDPSQAAADTEKAHSATTTASLAAARARSLLSSQMTGRQPIIERPDGANAEDLGAAQHLAEGLFHEYQDKLLAARSDLRKREAELATTLREVDKLRATSPLARQQANTYKDLLDKKYVAKVDYLDKEQSALQLEHELNAQLSHVHELESSVSEQRAIVAGIDSQFRREQLDALEKAMQQLAQTKNDETKANTRQAFLKLTAPVDGTVQQLAVHTKGGVVTTAQNLMEIVPDDLLEVEASIENKDIGFVKEGQDAVVKIEAFPYTKFGYIKGVVKSLARDSSIDKQDRKLGMTFVARIQLSSNSINVNGQPVGLTPGMAVTAEIKTGKRSVVRYFLDPLVETAQESMHER